MIVGKEPNLIHAFKKNNRGSKIISFKNKTGPNSVGVYQTTTN